MKTQCPHCRQQFSVPEELSKQSSGMVRCGNCMKPFDPELANTYTTYSRAVANAAQRDPESEPHTRNKPGQLLSDERIKSLAHNDDKPAPQQAFTGSPNNQHANNITAETALADIDAIADERIEPQLREIYLEVSQLEDDPSSNSLESSPNLSGFDFERPALNQRENSKAINYSTNRNSAFISLLVWFIGLPVCALLICSLALQIGLIDQKHLHSALKNVSTLNTSSTDIILIDTLCELLDCPYDKDLFSIEYLSVHSGSNLNQNATLVMESVIKNISGQQIAHPTLELTLLDRNNRIIAARRFSPSEYFDSNIQTGTIATNALFNAQLEFIDPGSAVSSYQLQPLQ